MAIDYRKEPSVVDNSPSLAKITKLISAPVEGQINKFWLMAIVIPLLTMGLFVFALGYSVYMGVGLWGNNNTVGWGFPIVNFVFWIGIGHAGTLISAILFLLRQKWRNGIARYAEAMTIFAVMTAGIFPLFHVGRVWLAGYLFPYPNKHAIWPNFISPLEWDVFAVSTYFTVSVVFWYLGLIPDLATLKTRTSNSIKKFFYSVFSLGWRFSNRHWQHYEKVYLTLAGFATPLVLSVHTIVSFDFATSNVLGWHTTIFPPYFVAGAIFSGFGMVVTCLVPARKVFGLEDLVTMGTMEKMNKIILLTGSIVGYAYGMEFFIAWYSGNPLEQFVFINRAFGPYAWAYWIMISCNVISPQLFWFKKIRTSIPLMFIVSIFVNVGMWYERYVIAVTSLTRDYVPSNWGFFHATVVDIAILFGSFGFFFTLMMLFMKFLPSISIAELKAVSDDAQAHHHHGGEHHE